MGVLKERMLAEMQLRNFSPATIKTYIHYVRSLTVYFNKPPSELTQAEIKNFLLYLINERKLSSSALNCAYCAIRFFFANVMGQKSIFNEIPHFKREKSRPAVLDVEEVRRLFTVTQNLKYKTIFITIYSAGLRISEATRLKVADIDSKRMQIFVRNGKGNRDRYTLLSEPNLEFLRLYWKAYKPSDWLFYHDQIKEEHISTRSIQAMFKKSVEKAGIIKNVSVHTLRHSFATHLLENGEDLHRIRLLLGHASLQTTSMYLHLKKKELTKSKSPLELMNYFPSSSDNGNKRTSPL